MPRPFFSLSERFGFALHLRAHQILFDNFDNQGIEADYFTFMALLVTKNVMFGWREVSRQLATAEGLRDFIAELYEMVDAYKLVVPCTERWLRAARRGGAFNPHA